MFCFAVLWNTKTLTSRASVCSRMRLHRTFYLFIYVNLNLTFSILTSPHREIVLGYICTKLTLIQFYGEKDQWKFQAFIFSLSYSHSNKCTEKNKLEVGGQGIFFFFKKSVLKSISYMKLKLTAVIMCIKFETVTFSRISQVAKQKHFMIWDGTTTLKTNLTHFPRHPLSSYPYMHISNFEVVARTTMSFPKNFFKSWCIYPFFIKSQLYSLQPELIVKCQSQRVYPTWCSC